MNSPSVLSCLHLKLGCLSTDVPCSFLNEQTVHWWRYYGQASKLDCPFILGGLDRWTTSSDLADMSGAGDAWDGRPQRPGQQQQQPWDRTVGPLTLTLNFRSSSCHNPAQHQLITSTQPASLGLVTSWIISNSNDQNWFHRLIDHWLPFAALSSGIRTFWMEMLFSVPHSCSANWAAGAIAGSTWTWTRCLQNSCLATLHLKLWCLMRTQSSLTQTPHLTSRHHELHTLQICLGRSRGG